LIGKTLIHTTNHRLTTAWQKNLLQNSGDVFLELKSGNNINKEGLEIDDLDT
jgi:hypothetical protein